MAPIRKTARKRATKGKMENQRLQTAAAAPAVAAPARDPLREAEPAGPANAPRRAAEMTQEERDATTAWFSETRDALGRQFTAIGALIAAASSGEEKDDLLKTKGDLLGRQQMLDRREEAFFADGSTENMRAPSAAQVKRTRDLSEALGEAIASQRVAKAIARLASDLADLVLAISQPG